jgi:hypothetical protein
MKGAILMIALTALVGFKSLAQLKGFGFGPYAEMAWPTGDLQQTNKNGIGAGVSADIRLGKIGVTASAGYMHFAGKTTYTGDGRIDHPAISAVPLRAGIKYRIVPLLYAKLESGMVNYTNGAGSAIIISPGIGLRILGLDIQAKYESWIKDGSNNFWGAKIGYNF